MRAESIGVYPGTFDPITFGHMDIIRRALKVVDKLIIAVALDTTKKPAFGLDERASMIEKDLREVLSGEDVKRCAVKTFSGLLMKFAANEGAGIIVRGLRAISDFEY